MAKLQIVNRRKKEEIVARKPIIKFFVQGYLRTIETSLVDNLGLRGYTLSLYDDGGGIQQPLHMNTGQYGQHRQR